MNRWLNLKKKSRRAKMNGNYACSVKSTRAENRSSHSSTILTRNEITGEKLRALRQFNEQGHGIVSD